MRRCSAALALALLLLLPMSAHAGLGDPLRCGPVRDTFDRSNSTDPGPLWTENAANMVIAGNMAKSGPAGTPNPLMTYTGAVTDATRACVRFYGGGDSYVGVALRQGTSTANSLWVELVDEVGHDGALDTLILRKGNGGAQLDKRLLAKSFGSGRMSLTAFDDGSRNVVSVGIESTIGGGATVSEALTASYAQAPNLGNGLAVGVFGDASLDDFSTPSAAPVVAPGPGTTAYTEHAPAVVLAPALTVTDDDDANLQGAEISDVLDGQFGDALQFTNTAKITATTGNDQFLVLKGTATVAEYQAALRSVRFSTTSGGVISPKRISIRVDDGASYSTPVNRNVVTPPVDDTPILTASSTPLDVTEGDAPKAIDPGLKLDDPDRSFLSSASVRIVDPESTETLGFVAQNNITGTFADGVLTLSGAARNDYYQTALRSVTYANTSENPFGTRSIEFRAADRTLESAPATRMIALTGVDDPAVVTTTAAPLGYRQGDPGVLVDPGVTVSDVDNTQLQGATVTVDGAATLGFASQNGIAGTFAGGVLTLTGTATLAQYQDALRSVTFATSIADSPRTVTFAADDGAGAGTGASRTIAVAAAPVTTATATPTASATPTAAATTTPAATAGPTVTATAAPTVTATATPGPALRLSDVSLKQHVKRGTPQVVRFTLNGPATVHLVFAHKQKRVRISRTYTAAGSYRVRKPWHYVAGHWRVTVTAGDAPPVTERFSVKRRSSGRRAA